MAQSKLKLKSKPRNVVCLFLGISHSTWSITSCAPSCLTPPSTYLCRSSLSSLPTPPPLLLSLIIKSNKLFSIDLLAASNKQHPRNGADPEAAPLFPLLHSPPSTCRGCWLTTHWEHLMCNNDLYLGTQSARCWNSLCQSRRSGLSRLGGNASTSLIIRMWIFLFGFSHTYTRAHAHIHPLRGK